MAGRHDASDGATPGNTVPAGEQRTGPLDRRARDQGPPPGTPERRKVVRRRSDVLKPRCPWCGACASRIYRSVGQYVRDDRYRRRHRCDDCGGTWPTIEHLDVVQFAKDLAKLGKTLTDLGIDPNLDAAEALAFVRDLCRGKG